MENLFELVNLVNPIKTQKIEIIGREKTKYGKLVKKLYDGIVSGKYETDQEAAMDIYNTPKPTNKYANLKIHLTQKLINTLFFIDVSDLNYSDLFKRKVKSERWRGAINILMSRGANQAAIRLAEKLIKKTEYYEFTEISLDIARSLLLHYRTHDINAKKEKFYKSIVSEKLALFIKEVEMEDYYSLTVKTIANLKISKEKKNVQIAQYSTAVRNILKDYKSVRIGQLAYLIFTYEFEFKNNYAKVIESCKEAIAFFEAKGDAVSPTMKVIYKNKWLAACIPLKRFRAGEQLALQALRVQLEGRINWFITLEYYFLLSLHTREYEKAIEIYKQVIANKQFKKLSEDYRQIWLVYNAYLTYLRTVGKVVTKEVGKFKVAKFMNDVPLYSKDKKGVNVAIIIIQILFLIAQGKYNPVIDRMESIRMYVHAHLRDDDSLRSNIFIKMLMEMVKAHFHKNGTIRRTKELKAKLDAAPIMAKGNTHFVEIVPYEELWAMCLEFLNNKAR